MQFFIKIPSIDTLFISKETKEMKLYEPFIMMNPPTKSNDFPKTDYLYYKSLESQLLHLLYKFKSGWISYERQVILSGDECISTVHFIFDENKEVSRINVFQRSSNLLNLEDDVQFFNYFINKHLSSKQIELLIFVSMPHVFNGKTKKIED